MMKYILCLLLIASCESKIDDLKSEHITSNVVTTETDGVVTGTISSNANSDQVLVGASGSNAAEASVTFPPGALAISTEISIGEATDQSTAILTSLGVTTGSQTGAPIYIGPTSTSTTVEVGQPLTIQLPIPLDQLGTGLVDTESKLGLLYTIYKNGWKSGIIPLTKENLVGAFLKQTFEGLGYFQVIYLVTAVATKEVTSQLRPSLGKNDETDTDEAGTIADYQGYYAGTVTEKSNVTATGASGNGKYCALATANLKLWLSPYNILVYKVSTPIAGNVSSDFDGDLPSFGDLSEVTPTSFTKTYAAGRPKAAITDTGVNNSGVKYTAANVNAVKDLKVTLTGGFSGTKTKAYAGTLKAFVGDETVCEYDLELSKQ